MPEAVAAPAAAPSSAPAQATKPGEAQAQGRQNDGKFSPKHPVQPSQAQGKPAGGELNARAANVGKPEGTGEQQQEQKPPEPKKYRFKSKVDGVESEEEYDEASLVRQIQLAKAAQKRMAEAAETRKQLEADAELLKRDPAEYLRSKGLDFDALAAERLAAQARRQMMPPEQAEYEQRSKELEAREARIREYEQQQQQQQHEAQVQAAWQAAEPKFMAALEASELPRDTATMHLLASVGEEFAAAGVALEPEQVVAEVQRRQAARIDRYIVRDFKADPSRAVNFLRKHGLLDAVRAELDKEWSQRSGIRAPAAPPAPPEPQQETSTPIFSESAWKKALRGR